MNVGAFLTKSARSFPHRTAIVYGERKMTYAEFDRRANRLANALNGLGVGKGDHVALLQYNYPEILKRELRARFWEARDRKV